MLRISRLPNRAREWINDRLHLQDFRERVTLRLSRRPLLLIYQMGKVGSQTIEATLRAAGLPHRIWRGHVLSPEQERTFGTWLEDPSLSEVTRASLRNQLNEARRVYHTVTLHKSSRGLNQRKLDVVVGVREPVGLLLASIFQNYPNYFRSLSEMTTTACRSVLLMAGSGGHARNQRICDTIDYVHRWFDVELRGVLGIDVYAQPFEHSQGYAIYENSFARVLVYRYENFGVIGPILEEFLGTTLPTLVNRNIGAEKDYGTLYGEIKQRLRLPAEFLAQQYGSRLAQHFYTPRELDHLAARWRQ